MVKLIMSVLAIVSVVGCATDPQRVITETIEVSVPILYCPAPPTIARPVLPIHTMTPEELANDGEIAKHYKATIKILIDYAKDHEMALGEYNDINASYNSVKKSIETAPPQ